MPLVHKFENELIDLENDRTFCSRQISQKNKLLIIGTFNPDEQSYLGENIASWFYGRVPKNRFWKYLPESVVGNSLHPTDGHFDFPLSWKEFCINEKVIIIDLIKRINTDTVLQNFSDREVENKISDDLVNVDTFDITSAFKGITFDRVLYSLKWSDIRNLPKLFKIRSKIDTALLTNGCIQTHDQIKCCKTPWWNNAGESWNIAINN